MTLAIVGVSPDIGFKARWPKIRPHRTGADVKILPFSTFWLKSLACEAICRSLEGFPRGIRFAAARSLLREVQGRENFAPGDKTKISRVSKHRRGKRLPSAPFAVPIALLIFQAVELMTGSNVLNFQALN
jgi:hypothetical protein